jgi:hypothetical protein
MADKIPPFLAALNMGSGEGPPAGVGFCDLDSSDSDPNRLLYWRYDTQYFTFTKNGGGDLVLPAADTQTYFTQGIGNGTGSATIDQSSTNSLKDGGLVRTGQVFEVLSLAFATMEPVVLTGTPVTDIAYSPIVSGPSGGYTERLKKAVMENIFGTAAFSDDRCTMNIGLIHLFGGFGQIASNVASGSPYSPELGVFGLTPLLHPAWTSSSRDSDQLSVDLSSPTQKTLTVESDPTLPLPAGIETVSVPVRVIAFGVRQCKPSDCQIPCDAPGQMDAVVQAVLRAMGK